MGTDCKQSVIPAGVARFFKILLSCSKSKRLLNCFVDKQKGKCYTDIGYKMGMKIETERSGGMDLRRFIRNRNEISENIKTERKEL